MEKKKIKQFCLMCQNELLFALDRIGKLDIPRMFQLSEARLARWHIMLSLGYLYPFSFDPLEFLEPLDDPDIYAQVTSILKEQFQLSDQEILRCLDSYSQEGPLEFIPS